MALPSTLLFIALLSIGFTVSLAQLPLFDISLAGTISCPNASLATVGTFRVIPQATVDVVCGLSRIPLLFNPELCQLRVILPVGSCVFVPPGGSIILPITAIKDRLNIVSTYIPGAPTYVVT
ncbi:hypothetical protein Salat_0066400 [Sesamum alatum]|uniref:Uncharacterized protein n=1 Tax=Sesamum alatum TaxID=300844 RepID=A0AAE1YV34_9LAMI|nr:hypothetical protein Salat_0066400 [Sesamum alatum]